MEYDKLIEGASEGVMAEKEEIPLGGIPIPSVEEQRNINAELNERMRNPYLRQEGGSHYKDMAIQPITYITRNNIGFAEGNIIKYISRWRNKNGIEDLKKALHTLQILIHEEENK